MATTSAIAKRRADAEAEINENISALAAHFEIEIPTLSYPVRDLEMRKLYHFESIGKTLTLISEKLGLKGEAEMEKAEAEETEKPKPKGRK